MTTKVVPRKAASDQLVQAETLWKQGEVLLRMLDLHDPPAVQGLSAAMAQVSRGWNAGERQVEVEGAFSEMVAAAREEEFGPSRIPGLFDFRSVVLFLDRRLSPVRNAREIWRKNAENSIEDLEREAEFGAAVADDPNREPALREAWARRRDENLETVKVRREAIARGDLPENPPLPRTVAQGVARMLSPYETTSLYARFVSAHEALGRSLEHARAAQSAVPKPVGPPRKHREKRPSPTELHSVLYELTKLSDKTLQQVPLAKLVADRCDKKVVPKTITRCIDRLRPVARHKDGIDRKVIDLWDFNERRANPTMNAPKGTRGLVEEEDLDVRGASDDADGDTKLG